ncbi:hypothetical protein F2Q70_00012072 [Brassica cretica]|uniref:Uncharacterized protein n=1 Tax=Brassica cretica TaxID=69181 RepID=A0A8S9M4G5_BRACR|nr:hypothetical protein F2Q70_00012072 [Brassica cretica]
MAMQKELMDVHYTYLERILPTSFRQPMGQTTSSCNNALLQNTSRREDEYGIYRDDQRYARDVDEHTIRVHNKDIRRLLERASRDEPNYICLPEHASSFTQTKLVQEIYTKDEINEMFYEICGEQEKNKEDFHMKLDGVYYPLNDSINWLTTCMEEMRQDIAIIQRANDGRDRSVGRRDLHIALETTEERLDRRCDDIYFPMDLSISALTSKIEAIQGELVAIQSYIARRPEASASIDKRNNKSTDTHRQISVDDATNRGSLVQKMTSDMSDTHNHGEEISADTYATVMRHQFNLESLGDRLQKIEYATTTMKDKWRRGDEAMRDFTGTWTDLEISDDFGAFWSILAQAPEMTIELGHRSILRNKYRSMLTSEHRSTVKRAESPFARPFTELDQSSSANGRAGPKTDSARPFAELDQPSSANGRAGSTETHLRLVLVIRLPKLHQTHSCFVSIGGIVGTLRFKNRGNSSFLEGHSD